MDSPEINEPRNKGNRNSLRRMLFRSCFAVLSSLLVFLLIFFATLYTALLVGNLSFWSPISVHSRCRIVSSSVDLRSSKVCELGLLNYKAKNVFYPLDRKRYRCHYDYYWASVFKVEYIDHAGQARFAHAEAPDEALPNNCRPSFGVAWLAKDKFKVNETYECWYTLGTSKVNINYKGLFNCQAENPSTAEMLKRCSILFTRILKSSFFSSGSVTLWRWDLLAGLISGYITALLSVTVIGFLPSLASVIRRRIKYWMSSLHPNNEKHMLEVL
ncbi:uncharacterized protein LOC127243683 isoform X2 [Andrographis paniculata]|uniref:uncharacterized protein LOC127243683 isoform X2 n=1 Tax=Andrographis paniculata TaxID=175694 RepID=UPI0021E7F32C|nr:uncharacterized protein LOC127243683 isoform X2 [Andrographis paniculata]